MNGVNKIANRFITFVSNNKKKVAIASTIIIIVGVVVGLAISFLIPKPLSSIELQQSIEQQTEKLTTSIGSKVDLPDETPIVSRVTDKTLLEGEIFEKAENDDKVLIYSEARLMVIYRESTDEIIATGPVGTAPVEGKNNVPTGVDQ
ncbi:hypothetical protein LJC64_01675 [Ruminococcaceae bacterium OttesenSCG-928-A11]|nr:hypothetical protein [Ruminococcaceae bacterium OttesenSCG-928-A11]